MLDTCLPTDTFSCEQLYISLSFDFYCRVFVFRIIVMRGGKLKPVIKCPVEKQEKLM